MENTYSDYTDLLHNGTLVFYILTVHFENKGYI